ncbi:hypothetical protein M406DRAFT_86125 [Cryphonectria parasitica EP155]|uniref:Carrier domain-containing protein n=1 Tax=Cryphonectria parasitica (strain ATCC 38755 / EP155) TaxID=660469 RepID=A0A9P5CJZ0_CRYP1|nr:uncharacterized protein M406DRAFT_86125 [Cryphonectria parasitica EP155]KAF3760416.1 hypothetical protein M406DRAFT_86125 [Cryphonectria parasitica EP155]
MACRFSGGIDSPDKLWEFVSQGRSAWSNVDETRFRHEAFYHKRNDGYSNSFIKGGYFLQEDVALFDNSFFSLTADAAAAMDPQIRMQLELTFEAMESAGIPMEKLVGTDTAVFSGTFTHDYHDNLLADPLRLPRTFITSTYAAMMANRISYFFDLKGPSAAVDTGCSTSLVALHMAAQSLRAGETSCAIVGGSCLDFNPEIFSSLSSLGTCGPDGKCYAFDHRAHGYGRGEGLATIIVKRLDDALADGDPICAVIREAGLNQDGKTATITSPDQEAQRRLIEACYQRAGLDPSETAVVEAHGTGTKQGDRAEARAIGEAISRTRPADKPVYLASVKTNLGHTEATSGLASLIKMAKSLEHGKVAPSINFERPNPEIDLEALRLKIPQTLEDWPLPGIRRASINNFGYGGTNAHVILEEATHHVDRAKHYSATHDQQGQQGRRLFVLSARDEAATKRMATNLCEYLTKTTNNKNDVSWFNDLAYTLGQRRSRFGWTLTATAESKQELVQALSDTSPGPLQASNSAPRLGFVFNGQGAQWFGMGRELMDSYPTFLRTLEECDAIIQGFGATWSLVEELRRDQETSRVDEVQFSMPLSCAVQLALVCLLEEWNIRPSAVCSHSSGEVAAAFAAGALDLGEAMACTYFRGLINSQHLDRDRNTNNNKTSTSTSTTTAGAMMAVGLGEADVAAHLGAVRSGRVVVACVNSPSSVTVSGDAPAVEELAQALTAEGIFARRLKVQAAFHSHHMLALEDAYRAALRSHMRGTGKKRTFRDGVVFTSPVHGGVVNDANELGPEHWVRNMVQPVLFAQSLQRMVLSDKAETKAGTEAEGPSAAAKQPQQNIDMLVEVGPHGALAGPIRQCLGVPSLRALGVGYGSCLTRGQDAVATLQRLAGSLLAAGVAVDMAKVNFPHGGLDRLRALSGLPSYPWTHSVRFWNESRTSRDHRFRRHAVHDLLGIRVPGTSNLSPVWRHILRASEVPWVYDHVVQSNIVYPGSGYIAMAIEAMRQLHEEEETGAVVSGYRLRDVDILRALIIPEDDEGVEVQLFLEPGDDRLLAEGWRQFHIYSAPSLGDGWVEIAKGLIAVDSSSPDPTQRYKMSPKDLFTSLHAVGVNHGPIFQNLTRIRMADDRAVTAFQVADSAATMPHNFQQPHVVHPITLDAVFQAAYPTLSPQKRKLVGTAIPRHIKGLYISASISSRPGHRLLEHASLSSCNRQGFDVSAAVLSAEDGARTRFPLIEVDKMHFQSLGSPTDEDEGRAQEKLCLVTEWRDSFSLNDQRPLEEALKYHTAPEDEKTTAQDILRATYHLVHDALAQLTDEDVRGLAWHHRALHDWMLRLEEQAAQNELAPRSARWAAASAGSRQMLYDKVAGASVHGALVVRVGANLLGILRGSVAPLELMLQDQLLTRFYQGALRFGRSTTQAARIAQALAAETPRARYLEIGGGTGGATMPILQALGGGDTGQSAQFAHYDFTDVSVGFFQAARERFQPWADMMSYRALDIEDEDIEGQGFEAASYDVVVAAQVLHATKNITDTMRRVRRLLRDGARLVLIETTRDTPDLTLIFGTVAGWWLSEEPERKHNPNMSLEAWDRVLRATGFSGLDLSAWDCEDPTHQSLSCIVSTAVAPREPDFTGEQVVLAYDSQQSQPPPPAEWCRDLVAHLARQTGVQAEVSDLAQADVAGKLCIFVSGLDGTPQHFSEAAFGRLRSMITSVKGLVWVTTGATMDCAVPENAIHLGLVRTARIEDSSKILATLDLDLEPWQGGGGWRAGAHDIITRVFKAVMDRNREAGTVDFEFAERAGRLLVPRLHRDPAEHEAFTGGEGRAPELHKFDQPERVLRMHVDVPGLLDSIVFRDDPDARRPLPADWVEVAPRVFGLNFRDIMVAMGRLDEPVQELGNECGGVVTRVGALAAQQSGLRVGDRVCALTFHGHFSGRVRVPWTSVARIPDHISFEEAASIGNTYVTAHCALVEAARAEAGETVLVHAAAGGVGQACIALAQSRGVEVFATVGTLEKRQFLVTTYGIPDDHIFSSRDASFAPRLLAATGGRGVDIIVNSLAGSLLDESWHLLAPYGRFVEIGKQDIHRNKSLDMEPFRKALSFVHVDVIHLVDYKPRATQRILQDVIRMVGDGTIQNRTPITSFSLSDIARAFRVMQAGKHIGKIVIVPGPEDRVKVCSTAPPLLVTELASDATFLVVGGLSGIGQSISRWLIDHGAKSLLLVSRNALSRPGSVQFGLELAAAGGGAEVTIRDCDISDKAMLAALLEEHRSSGRPPIRGVIHSGMVLDDSVLERMTYAQWCSATKPKIEGTRNLDEAFGDALDFFIVLSSANGVLGCTSQANYAAGGTYQDALVRRRAALGRAGVVLDLGLVNSVGFVAETAGVKDRLVRSGGHRPLEEAEVLALVAYAIRNPRRTPRTAQIAAGITGAALADGEPRFAALSSPSLSADGTGSAGHEAVTALALHEQIAQASSAAEAVIAVQQAVVAKLADMFVMPEADIDPAQPLSRYGVDSLVAVELRNWLVPRARIEMSIFDLLGSSSLTGLAGKVVQRSSAAPHAEISTS